MDLFIPYTVKTHKRCIKNLPDKHQEVVGGTLYPKPPLDDIEARVSGTCAAAAS